jgi:hypothetical protein
MHYHLHSLHSMVVSMGALALLQYTSYILQPLDLGCFSSLKTEYRRYISNYIALTDKTRVKKAKFLKFYA